MIYLLDANTLIDANRDYYPLKAVPQFWTWLLHHGKSNSVKIPIEIYEEIKIGKDKLADWVKRPDIKNALLYNKRVLPSLLAPHRI